MAIAHSSYAFKVFFVVLSHFFFHVFSNITTEFPLESINPWIKRKWSMDIISSGRLHNGRFYLGSKKEEAFGHVSSSSNSIGFLCYPCDPCFQHQPTDKFFNPAVSNTYKKASCIDNKYCDSLQGKGCDDNYKCKFYSHRNERFINGTLSIDTLRFYRQAGTVTNELNFGCIHAANGSISQHATGSIGLGRHNLSLVMQLGVDIFSICLPYPEHKLGRADFGNAVEAPGPKDIKTSLVGGPNEYSYYVNIKAFTVEDRALIIINEANFTFMVDSGEPLSHVDPNTLMRLKENIIAVVSYPLASVPGYPLCFEATSQPNYPALPWIRVLFFDGGSIILRYRNIFHRRPSSDTWCLSFIAGDEFLLGSQTYWGRSVVVDLARDIISFGEYKKCKISNSILGN